MIRIGSKPPSLVSSGIKDLRPLLIARFELTHKAYRSTSTDGAGSFQNEPFAGDWTLAVSDNSSAHGTGQITGFEIYFNQ